MSNWLTEALKGCTLTEEVEGYLLGRGAKEDTIREEGMVTWFPLEHPTPDPEFEKWFGRYGEKLSGFLVCPMYSPRGEVIGFEARHTKQKLIRDYRLPEEAHQTFWLGTRRAVLKLWEGGDAWIVEGLFDLCPMEWVIPDKDAVLASVRAKLSVSHVEFLRRFCRGTVNMVYDCDSAGRKGTFGFVDETGKRQKGALDWLKRVGLNCRDIPYEGGKDPGVIWDKGGAPAVRAAFRF
jgi:hypothetical protein